MMMQGYTLLLTDLVLGAMAGAFAWSLHRASPGNQAARWWSRALGLIKRMRPDDLGPPLALWAR